MPKTVPNAFVIRVSAEQAAALRAGRTAVAEQLDAGRVSYTLTVPELDLEEDAAEAFLDAIDAVTDQVGEQGG